MDVQSLPRYASPTTGMNLTLIATVVMAIATLAIAVLTFFVWQLNQRQHQLRYEATLAVVGRHAETNGRAVHLEVLLTNPSETPAVIQRWEACLNDKTGFSQPDIGSGKLIPTRYFRAPTYVGGKGWAVTRREPAAFSIVQTLDRPVDSAVVILKLYYVSGGVEKVVEDRVPVS